MGAHGAAGEEGDWEIGKVVELGKQVDLSDPQAWVMEAQTRKQSLKNEILKAGNAHIYLNIWGNMRVRGREDLNFHT